MADCQLLIFQDEVREWCKQDEVLRTRYGPCSMLHSFEVLQQYLVAWPGNPGM
jgi:hypothetical protein